MIGYAVVFLLVFSVIQTIGSVLIRLVHTVNLGWIDRLLGGAAGGAIAIAVAGFALMLLTAILPVDTALLNNPNLRRACLTTPTRCWPTYRRKSKLCMTASAAS